jgi:type II secretory pathway component PulM
MNIRDRVKRILNMCGHALNITVHDRLDRIEARLSELRAQNAELAENHNAILQSAIHMIEALHESQSTAGGQREELKQLTGIVEQLRPDIAKLLDQAGDQSPRVNAAAIAGLDDMHVNSPKRLPGTKVIS